MDPEYLPKDTFTTRVPAQWRDQVPHVVEEPQGPRWVAGELRYRGWGATGLHEMMATPRGRAMRAAGYDPQEMRPSSPSLRLADHERDGVDAEVIYGPLRRFRYLLDMAPEVAALTAAAYNEYIAGFCRTHPHRFHALGGVPCQDPKLAAQELEHIARLSLVGAEMPFQGLAKPVWHPDWEPLWAAAAARHVPVHLHIGAAGLQVTTTVGRHWDHLAADAGWNAVLQMQTDEGLAGVVFSGALERHPGLKVVLGESGTGWIPYLLDRMDRHWESHYATWKSLITTKPSDIFRRQMYATFQEEAVGPLLAEQFCPDSFMWGSDYPHSDGIWPDSQAIIQQTMGSLKAEIRGKILRDNAARLYHFE
jgi:predicted TIM-barrel fold metal-dependent hydrolase